MRGQPRWQTVRNQASCFVHLATPHPISRLHWILLKKGWDLSWLVPPPPAPRRRWGSNCSSYGGRLSQRSASLPHQGGRRPPPGTPTIKALGCPFPANPVNNPLPMTLAVASTLVLYSTCIGQVVPPAPTHVPVSHL